MSQRSVTGLRKLHVGIGDAVGVILPVGYFHRKLRKTYAMRISKLTTVKILAATEYLFDEMMNNVVDAATAIKSKSLTNKLFAMAQIGDTDIVDAMKDRIIPHSGAYAGMTKIMNYFEKKIAVGKKAQKAKAAKENSLKGKLAKAKSIKEFQSPRKTLKGKRIKPSAKIPRSESPSPIKRSPSPKQRSPAPKQRNTSPKRRSPSPKQRNTSPKRRSRSVDQSGRADFSHF